jgi:hypothetical protein
MKLISVPVALPRIKDANFHSILGSMMMIVFFGESSLDLVHTMHVGIASHNPTVQSLPCHCGCAAASRRYADTST